MFQTRERRPRFGELVQIDGSPHAWFEGRGPRCTLIVFIDDATSRLMALRFVPSETTRAYLETLRGYVLAHGRPLAFYSDRHGIFRVNAKEAGERRPAGTEFETGGGTVGYSIDPGFATSGQGTVWNVRTKSVAGPSGERDASSKHLFDGGQRCVFGVFHRRFGIDGSRFPAKGRGNQRIVRRRAPQTLDDDLLRRE